MYMSAIVADFLKLDQACISQFVFNCESPLLGYYNRARSRDFGRVIKAKKVVKGNKTVLLIIGIHLKLVTSCKVRTIKRFASTYRIAATVKVQ